MELEKLLRQCPGVWRAGRLTELPQAVVPTALTRLDRELAGGGWPRGALSEIISAQPGPALGLVVPALASLSQGDDWVLWVDPPYVPYPPGLVERGVDLARVLVVDSPSRGEALWMLEQGLRSGGCCAALAWVDPIRGMELRRLQLAAEAGNAIAWCFRPETAAQESSPAALRLRLRARGEDLEVEILKRRGGWAKAPLSLRTPAP